MELWIWYFPHATQSQLQLASALIVLSTLSTTSKNLFALRLPPPRLTAIAGYLKTFVPAIPNSHSTFQALQRIRYVIDQAVVSIKLIACRPFPGYHLLLWFRLYQTQVFCFMTPLFLLRYLWHLKLVTPTWTASQRSLPLSPPIDEATTITL